MQDLEQIIEVAERLPPEERRRIAERLVQSADAEERQRKLSRAPRGPYALSVELAGTLHSDWTDVSANKKKHLADIYARKLSNR